MALFQGEARKFSITITSSGVTVDPSTLDDVRIWLYDKATEEVIAKWAVTTIDGYLTATIVGTTVVFYLDDTQTAEIGDGRAVIQVTVYDKYPGGQDMICTKKGLFAATKTAKI
jgi:hypothetical protein